MKTLTVLAALFLSGLASHDAHADCIRSGRHKLRTGTTQTVNWRITDGSSCVWRFKLASRSRIDDVRIASKPAHGIAGRDGVSGIAYRPEKGFKGGSDVFSFTVHGHLKNRAGDGVAVVRAFVWVQ